MKNIITITGAKHTGKMVLASKLSENSDCIWVKPYTDNQRAYPDCYHPLIKEDLDKMIEDEKPVFTTIIRGFRYVVFPSQLNAEYNILIVDDYALIDVKEAWNEHIITIKVHSDREEPSLRSGVYLFDHEFDEVYNVDTDDFDELVWRIEQYGLTN